jgi:NDP-sugar pyrophosphorylase family protein
VNVYEHMGSWIDIGRIDDLRRAQEQAAAPLMSRT